MRIPIYELQRNNCNSDLPMTFSYHFTSPWSFLTSKGPATWPPSWHEGDSIKTLVISSYYFSYILPKINAELFDIGADYFIKISVWSQCILRVHSGWWFQGWIFDRKKMARRKKHQLNAKLHLILPKFASLKTREVNNGQMLLYFFFKMNWSFWIFPWHSP